MCDIDEAACIAVEGDNSNEPMVARNMKSTRKVSVASTFGPWPEDRPTALRLGSKYFFTGRPCRNGHIELRFSKAKCCLQCNRDRMQRLRLDSPEYREKEKRRAIDRLKDPDVRAARLKVWGESRDKNRAEGPAARERDRQAARAHHDSVKDCPLYRKRKARKAREWHNKNKERANERAREYYKANKSTLIDVARNNKARRKGAEGNFTPDDVRRIIDEQGGQCVYCNADVTAERHVDHKTPIVRGGTNWPSNLQVLCPNCNLRKGAKTHEEFLIFLVECEEAA